MPRKRASGEGTLTYDPKRGLWVGRLPRSVDSKRSAVYASSQNAAREKLRRAIRDAESGLVVLNERSTLADYLDHWLDVVRSRVQSGALAPSTAAGYERVVRLHLQPTLGRIPLRQLTPGQVEALLGELQARGKGASACRHVRATLSRALSDAQRDELVSRNVARLTEPPHLEKRDPSAFSESEFARISAQCAKERQGALFLFAALTGLRRSEVLGLRWKDVSLDEGTFQVAQGLHQISRSSGRVTGETGLVTARPKTSASGNRLPLSRAAVSLLREHSAAQAAERLACPQPWPHEPEETFVFTTQIGTPLQPSNVARSWRRILQSAGVASQSRDGRARGMHELRRTFATRMRDQGVPLEDVQRLGRWSSSKMLLEVYSASDDDRLRRAAEAAGKAMHL